MSTIGITAASAATRIATASASSAGSAGSAAATAATVERSRAMDPAQTEEAENKPAQVHFPWLSRLSAGLEAASNKRAPFSTQIMGDNLNKQA